MSLPASSVAAAGRSRRRCRYGCCEAGRLTCGSGVCTFGSVRMARVTAAVVAAVAVAAAAVSAEDIGKLVLDEQQRNYTGTPFDPLRWESFVLCMDEASESAGFSVRNVTEAGWRGFLEYARSNGTADDPWNPPGYAPLPNGSRTGGWYEYNPQPMAANDEHIANATRIIITEPCNYNSNVAYYTSMTTMCAHHLHAEWAMPQQTVDLLIASFSTLASGSSFLHSSGTGLGGTMDTTPIGHISLAAYQAAVSSLPQNDFIANARPNATEPGAESAFPFFEPLFKV